MADPADKKIQAWQPLTPGGVAAFAEASFTRLLVVQVFVAGLVAAALVWLIHTAWFPAIASAINALPEQGRIAAGQLEWSEPPALSLAESSFLAFTVDVNHAGTARFPAHLQVEFGKFDWRLYSLFGFATVEYPPKRSLPFNRTALAPWWGAWAPALLSMVGAATFIGLLLVWTALACGYFLPAWLIGFFADRRLSLCGSWRLAGAALMPGALLMVGAIVAYGRGVLRPIDLVALSAAHVLLGWVYLLASPFFCPRRPAPGATNANPFATTPGSAPPPSNV